MRGRRAYARWALAGVLALGVGPVVAGCGGDPAPAAESGSVGPDQPNGVAELSADRILDLTTKAALDRSTVVLRGDAPSGEGPVSLDLALVKDRGGQGSVANGGQEIRVVVVTPDAWIQADPDFWTETVGEQTAAAIGDRWVLASTTDPAYSGVAGLADFSRILGGLLAPTGDVSVGETGEVDGRPAVALVSDAGRLWVATTGLPLPLRISREDGQGEVTFSDWDAPVTLTPPPDDEVVAASALPGGGAPAPSP